MRETGVYDKQELAILIMIMTMILMLILDTLLVGF